MPQELSKPSGSSLPSSGDTRTVELLRKIESKVIDPVCISKPNRRQLVAFLMGDGYSTAEMAQVLQVADRTIERDKRFIREANAIARDPKLVEQMVGRLVGEADLSVQRIRKAVRDKKVPPAVRVDAEHRCYQILSDLIQSLQRVGYLPTAAQKVEADLTHHVGEVPDLATMQMQVSHLKQICQQKGEEAPEAVQQLGMLEQQIVRAELASRVEDVSSTIDDQGVMNDESE